MVTTVENLELKQRLAQNVRRMIDDRGWTASELARRSGETDAAISRILNGKHVVGLDVAHRVAAALQTTVDFLLRDPEENFASVA